MDQMMEALSCVEGFEGIWEPVVQEVGEVSVHSAGSPAPSPPPPPPPPLIAGGGCGTSSSSSPPGRSSSSSVRQPLDSPQSHDLPHSTVTLEENEDNDNRHTLPDSHNKTSKAAVGRQCQICDDSASGFHYGVWSCEGCKAFFKRSLLGPTDYVCPATNTCTIDRHRRKSCQACRLRKCLEMGMYRNIRKERSPRPRPPKTTVKRRSTEECESMTNKSSTSPVSPPKIKAERSGGEERSCSYVSKLLEAGQPPARKTPEEDSTAAPIHPLVQHLLRIEPPPRLTWHDTSRPHNESSLMSSLLKLANEEIVDIINWAKSIPGYTELDLQQRIRLLESSWMEVLIAGLLWRSIPYPNTLVFTQDFRWDRGMCEAANMLPAGDMMMKMSQRLSQLSVTQEEFVLFRAIILLNADVVDGMPTTNSQLGDLQEQLQQALYYTSVKRLKKDASNVCQLLLLLPHIRQASINGIRHISETCSKHVVSVEMLDLLKEMMQAATAVPQ